MRDEAKNGEIGVLYGFRVLMTMFVAAYHFWQQGWRSATVRLFGCTFSTYTANATGYLFVDGFLLLSGFLLFLPYARARANGTPMPDTRTFYKRRAARILPSYVFTIAVTLLFSLVPVMMYTSIGSMIGDVLAHLTFTQTMFPSTHFMSPLNGAVWTVAVEVQLYLLFPWLAKAACRKPVLTLGSMCLCGWVYRYLVARLCADLTLWLNQMPAFLDVYALGMLCALAEVRFEREEKYMTRTSRCIAAWLCAVCAVLCVILLFYVRDTHAAAVQLGTYARHLSQLTLRLPWTVLLGLCMLMCAHMPRCLRFLLDNRLMRFLAGVSMNFYFWHQILAVRMRRAWFPDIDELHYTPGLQAAYTVLCWSVSFICAMALTYGLEKPAARLILKRAGKHKNGPVPQIPAETRKGE